MSATSTLPPRAARAAASKPLPVPLWGARMNADAIIGFALLAGALYALTRSGQASAYPQPGGYVPALPGSDYPGLPWPSFGGTDETGPLPAYEGAGGDLWAGADEYGPPPYDLPADSYSDPWASGEFGAGTYLDDPMNIGSQESAVGGGLDSSANNVAAMLAVIRAVESRGDYYVIAGGDRFTDTREHPFVLQPSRRRPLGTTASGAYQMVVGTWTMARDALGLRDFSPASQDAAAAWILQFKRPAAYPLVLAGRFVDALAALRREWEAFDKMLVGTYPVSIAQAQAIFEAAGGSVT